MADDAIRNKVWNIDLVVDDIRKFPQTYDTILQHLCKDGTCQTILRRKLNRLSKDGIICKTTIPGTRFGKVIFYILPKKYYILVEGTRTGSEVYIFFEYENLGKLRIRFDDYHQLVDGKWKKYKKDKVIFHGNTLKFI